MSVIKNILATAAAEIGTVSDTTTMDNKYNQWYYGGHVNNSRLHWCVVFVAWVFEQVGQRKLLCDGIKTASCDYVVNWAKTHGQWVTKDYQPGDLLLYCWDKSGRAQHIGILEEVVSAGVFKTVEGNTTSGAAKSAVARKTRYASNIIGAYRPNYPTSPIDNKISDWAKEHWTAAVAKGICDGTRPKDAATREEVIALMGRCGLFK